MKKYYLFGAIVVLVGAGVFLALRHASAPGFHHPGAEKEEVADGISDPQLKQAVIAYLENEFLKPSFGGKVFCSVGWTKVEGGTGSSLRVYVAHLCQEYRLGEGGEFAGGTGSSGAIALDVERSDGGYKVVNHQVPREGDEYEKDFLRIFPKGFKEALKDRGQQSLSAMIQSLDAENIYRARASLQGVDLPSTREAAIGLVQMKHPEFVDYPSDSLPPRAIISEGSQDAWYLAFVQNGSGRPILSAHCFKVAIDGTLTSVGEYTPQGNPEPLAISPRTCQ